MHAFANASETPAPAVQSPAPTIQDPAHPLSQEDLVVLDQMTAANATPDTLTFTALITACARTHDIK